MLTSGLCMMLTSGCCVHLNHPFTARTYTYRKHSHVHKVFKRAKLNYKLRVLSTLQLLILTRCLEDVALLRCFTLVWNVCAPLQTSLFQLCDITTTFKA